MVHPLCRRTGTATCGCNQGQGYSGMFQTVQAPLLNRKNSGSFALKLSSLALLSLSEIYALESLSGLDETVPRYKTLAMEGQRHRSAFLVKEGMAMRSRMMADGGRQIISFLIPGDLSDLHIPPSPVAEHSITALTTMRIAPISYTKLTNLCLEHPNIRAALLRNEMQENSILRERLVSLGRRDARSRIAGLLCELFWRHNAVGLVSGSLFQVPLTQMELGDALGLTSVHVNRTLKEFREKSLIKMAHRKLHVQDLDSLQEIAGVTSNYLYFDTAH